MASTYKISSAYLRLILQADTAFLDNFSADLADELSTAMSQDFVEGDLVNRLFAAIADQGLISWVSAYGAQLGVSSHGPIGFAALSAPDLYTALHVFADHVETRSSGTAATMLEEGGRLHYILEDKTGNELAGRWLIESGFLVAQSLIETIMAHPLGSQAELHFTTPKRAWHAQVQAIFNAPSHFDQADNRLIIPASWARAASPLYDAEAFRTNLAKAREIKLLLMENRGDVLELVRTRLLNHFDRRMNNSAKHQQIPGLEVLANELAMSPRTLIRKLAEKKTSYKKVLEQIRCQQAQALLRETHLTAAEIGEKLGYQEAANFGRAFRRWTKQSPASWRRQSN